MSRLALFGGVAALLLGLACDVLAAVVWKDYDFISQSNSELTAIGAPTRPVVVALLVAQSLLVVGLGLAAWTQAGSNTALRITAGLVTAYGVTGFAAQFFPTSLGERPAFLTPGVLLGAAGVLVSVLAIAFGAAAWDNWFRFFSIGILVAFAALTVLGFLQSHPRIGLQERVMGYSVMIWIAVLAGVLLNLESKAGAVRSVR